MLNGARRGVLFLFGTASPGCMVGPVPFLANVTLPASEIIYNLGMDAFNDGNDDGLM